MNINFFKCSLVLFNDRNSFTIRIELKELFKFTLDKNKDIL